MVDGEITGVETEMKIETPVTPAGPVDFSTIVPEAYAEKAWVQDVKDINGLFKMTDDLKSEMGKRPAGVPQDDGDWTEFNKTFGVPESGDKYDLPAPVEGGEEFQTQIRALLHGADISQRQAAKLDAGFSKMLEGFAPDTEAQEAEFQKLASDTFGDRQEDVMKIAKGLLDENVPAGFEDHVGKMSNKDLVIMASVLDSVQRKYISEDDLPKGDAKLEVGMSDDEKRSEGRTLMALPEFSDKGHPNHAAIVAKVNRLYGT